MRFCACTVHFNKRFLKVSLWVGDVLKWQESSFEREKNLVFSEDPAQVTSTSRPVESHVCRGTALSPPHRTADGQKQPPSCSVSHRTPPPPCRADVTGRQSASRPRGAGFPVSDEDPTFCRFSVGQSSAVGWGLACSFTYVCHRQRRATRGLRGWLAREMAAGTSGEPAWSLQVKTA